MKLLHLLLPYCCIETFLLVVGCILVHLVYGRKFVLRMSFIIPSMVICHNLLLVTVGKHSDAPTWTQPLLRVNLQQNYTKTIGNNRLAE